MRMSTGKSQGKTINFTSEFFRMRTLLCRIFMKYDIFWITLLDVGKWARFLTLCAVVFTISHSCCDLNCNVWLLTLCLLSFLIRFISRWNHCYRGWIHCLKMIYHPLYGMNNYVLIWGDCLSCDPLRGSHDSQSPHVRKHLCPILWQLWFICHKCIHTI